MPETDYMDSDQTEAPAGDESKDKDNTCLINKTSWPDAKPGDKKTFEAVHVYEDELAVKPVEAESPEEDKTEAGEEPGEEPQPTEASNGGGGYMD